jgi:protein-tyrosine phosphatase
MAQGILESLTQSEEWFIDSAGTANYHIGKSPDTRSIEVTEAHGIDISKQKCRQFTAADFDRFDFILAMDRENQRQITNMARNNGDRKKVMLILDGMQDPSSEVPDPYYGTIEDFEAVFSLLHQACMRFVSKVNR